MSAHVLYFVQARKQQELELMNLPFILMSLCILLTHAGSNLANTYYDYKHGNDTLEHSDDRAIVEKKVPPRMVLCLSLALLATATGCYIMAAQHMDGGANGKLLMCGLAGTLLGFFYTADPCSLKSHGLGDIVVFVCFGIIPMQAISISVVGDWNSDVLIFSVIPGMLACAILHANNVRDRAADRKAGCFTIAQLFSDDANFRVYLGMLLGSYAYALCLAVYYQHLRIDIVLVAFPWASMLLQDCRVGLRHAQHHALLPQLTAQHNLLFTTLLCMSLMHPIFLGRFLLAALFYMGGCQNVLMFSYNQHLVHEKLNCFLPFWGLKIPLRLAQVAYGSATLSQTVMSVLFIFGYQAQFMAKLLLAWLVLITLTVHNFWTVKDETVPRFMLTTAHSLKENGGGDGRPVGATTKPRVLSSIPTFPTEYDNEFVHFFKNMCTIGGFVLFIEGGL